MSRRTYLLLGLALLFTAAAATLAGRAGANAQVCDVVCVIMIEVDGLEPDDLTQATTPFLWELAQQGKTGATGTNFAGSARNGYVWQAPRGVMSAGTAPAAASLLTAGYTEQHGLPADAYIDTATGSAKYKRLTGPHDEQATGDNESAALPVTEPDAPTIFSEMEEQLEDSDYAWITGDPGLRELLDIEAADAAVSWAPTGFGDFNPSYCPIPREPREDGNPQPPDSSQVCPASDGQTTNQALTRLQHPDAADVAFAYIHLAGVGQAKLRNADVEGALNELDLSVARFLQAYASNGSITPEKWANTVLMVVGNHGYERTGGLRVPHPTNPDRDLESYLEGGDAGIEPGAVAFVPQGTFATVYPVSGTPEQRAAAIRAVWAKLTDGTVDEQCADVFQSADEGEIPPEAEPDCLRDVLYVDPGFSETDTIGSLYKTWHYDHIANPKQGETAVRSGSSGELIVTTQPGWAFGRASTNPVGVVGDDQEPITNAYPAAAGGPRNRAIAAFINGPNEIVRSLGQRATAWHPVTEGPDTGDPRQAAADPTGETVNDEPIDDANATGHELQPETVDFMPTAAALIKLSVQPRQLVGRLLQEAFIHPLSFPVEEEDIGDPDPDPEPPPPPPPIQFLPPPPPPEYPEPKDPFPFYGLLRNLRAAVVDEDGRNYAKARPASLMSHIVINADFGKPLTKATLTFYRDILSRRDRARVRECSEMRRRARRVRCLRRVKAATAKRHERAIARCKKTEEDDADRSACIYEAKARARFERRKRRTCVRTMARRLRAARRGRAITKALEAPCVVPLARFDPFTVRRGQVELKLQVPVAYKPSHIGMAVQEVRKMTAKERRRARAEMEDTDKPLFPYVGFGPKDGAITAITDARRLHRVKPRRTRSRSG